jgi:hypothetical protein
MVDLPHYGLDVTTHDGLEQSHTLEISQVDCAPMLNLVRCADAMRSP